MARYTIIFAHLLLLVYLVTCTERKILSKNRNQCIFIEKEFSKKWYHGEKYLSIFLNNLKSLNCPQFKQQCSKQTFAFTEFTSLMYLKFCNESKLIKKCYNEVKSVLQKQSVANALGSWKQLVTKIDLSKLNKADLKRPCLQVAMSDSRKGSSQFSEVIDIYVPFCSVVWCGFADVFFHSGNISVWTCMTQTCHTKVIAAVVVCSLLAFAITLCNITVLGVILTNKKLLNAQVVYRASLAFSDLLVGVLVLPSFVYNMFNYLQQDLKIEKKIDSSNLTWNEIGFNGTTGAEEIEKTVTHPVMPSSYLSTIGLITAITIAVSVNTLAAAAIDRFVALHSPLKYRTTATNFIARIACIAIWIFVACVSLLPFWLKDLNYITEHTSLVFAEGDLAIYTYMFTFCVPLIVMWCFTIGSFVAYKKHYNTRKNLISNDLIKKEVAKHVKLVITLGIMAGAFTITMLPSIALISHLFLDDDEFFQLLNLSRQNPVNYFQVAEVSVTILYLGNSLSNFFIYSARDKQFRQASKRFYLNILGKITPDSSILKTRSTD